MVDFALIRARVRDGSVVMKHQLGEFIPADGLTKGTNQAQKALVDFLHSNRLGAEGVEVVKLDEKVENRLQAAYAAKKLHPNNLTTGFLEKLADAVHLKLVYPNKTSCFYADGQIAI